LATRSSPDTGAEPATIRSYQRIFRPERRIYQVQGRPLPVPGGVPLRWLGYAVATLLAVILVSSRSATVALLAAAAAGLAGFVWGGRIGAVVAAAGAMVAVPMSGWFVAALDWPLRLVILPALVATLATQATPDGRAAHRYAAAWLRVRLDGGRRSLGRPLPPAGTNRFAGFGVWVGSDERSPHLGRARVHGPVLARFREPVLARRRRRGRRVVRPLGSVRRPRRWAPIDSLDLASGERVELRP
jgi:hypothetical protein